MISHPHDCCLFVSCVSILEKAYVQSSHPIYTVYLVCMEVKVKKLPPISDLASYEGAYKINEVQLFEGFKCSIHGLSLKDV